MKKSLFKMTFQFISEFFQSNIYYETTKVVEIKNTRIGFIYRLTQLFILCYVIGYVIVYKKGYQETDTGISVVSTKLKGTAYVDFKNFSNYFNGIHVFDSSDYVIPPRESNGFFVMTNMVITPNQTQGRCPSDDRSKRNYCSVDGDCQKYATNSDGVKTGVCVHSAINQTIKVCEVNGWCPVERDTLPMPGLGFSKDVPLLDNAKYFTVLIKNHVHFRKFDVLRKNIFGFLNRKELRKCKYDKKKSPFCPIFRLGDIVRYCGDNFTQVAYKGAIYGITINWDCDLDYDLSECVPKYEFRRMDDPNAPISPGFNFRYSNYFITNGRRYRTLTKVFGVKFIVIVEAKAGRFDVVPLFLNLGAGLALLGLATVACDFLIIYCLRKRTQYKRFKVDSFHDGDETEEEKQGMLKALPPTTDK